MTQETQKVAETTAAIEDKGLEFILTKSGVMITGHELVGDKMTAIICESIGRFQATGLTTIVLRNDGFPIAADDVELFGSAHADTYSMSIGLKRCWSAACETAEKGETNLGFMSLLWVNILSAVGHELDHLAFAHNDRDLYEEMRKEPELSKELEDAAESAAILMIVGLAREFDIEIPPVAELGWFGVQIMELFTNKESMNLDWVVKARTQMENSVIYSEGEGKECFSFRDFIKKAHAADDEGSLWDQPTTCVNLTAHLDNGVVEEFKAETVVAPSAEVVDLEASEVAEVMAAAEAGEIVMVDGTDDAGDATIDMVATGANGQFVGAGIEVGDDSPDVVITAETAGTLAGAEANTQYVADPASANTTDAPVVPDVPLPTPVAAATQAVAQAATTAVPPAQPTPTTYTPNTLAPETMAAVLKSVWQTLYHHVFTKCGWQQNPQTGRFMFTNAAAVLEGVNIQHILSQFGADNFIMEYDTLSAEGTPAPEMCQGMIRGKTTSQAGLPSYSLYLNINGQRIKRTFMPQNPDKMGANNAYTKSAVEAGTGNMIVWVFKDEAPDTAPFNEKCAVTIKNNVYEVMT